MQLGWAGNTQQVFGQQTGISGWFYGKPTVKWGEAADGGELMDKDRCLEKLTCTGRGEWRRSCHKTAEMDGEASAKRRVGRRGSGSRTPCGESDYHSQITLIVRVLEMPLSGEGAWNAARDKGSGSSDTSGVRASTPALKGDAEEAQIGSAAPGCQPQLQHSLRLGQIFLVLSD